MFRKWCSRAGRWLPALAVALLFALPATLPVAQAAERPGRADRAERGESAQRPPPARNEPDPPQRVREREREPSRVRPGVSIDQAISQVERRYKARVVRAEQAELGGRPIYVLRLLSDEGRVSIVRVDAETGGVM